MSNEFQNAQEKRKPRAAIPRSNARFAAIQALYQMDVAQTDLNDVIEEFSVNRLKDLPDIPLENPLEENDDIDKSFFRKLLTGIIEQQRVIDQSINAHLAVGWDLTRIDSILRAILRAGTFEVIARKDIPAKVVINEYMNIAHAFFEGDETGVVNAVLDKLARQHRFDEATEKTLS
ncbi:MAG: transcription antitermination factor NusB [Pseudomonadota bacterium]